MNPYFIPIPTKLTYHRIIDRDDITDMISDIIIDYLKEENVNPIWLRYFRRLLFLYSKCRSVDEMREIPLNKLDTF